MADLLENGAAALKPIEDVVYELLKEKNLTLTTAESCTGGLLAGTFINVAGASDVYREGFITYANEAKMKYLGVTAETLSEHGAVSRECAEEMARGAARTAEADVAVVTTGIAGPDGGTDEKPVGLVYIGVYYKDEVTVEEFHFKGGRREVRDAACIQGLELARKVLLKN